MPSTVQNIQRRNCLPALHHRLGAGGGAMRGSLLSNLLTNRHGVAVLFIDPSSHRQSNYSHPTYHLVWFSHTICHRTMETHGHSQIGQSIATSFALPFNCVTLRISVSKPKRRTSFFHHVGCHSLKRVGNDDFVCFLVNPSRHKKHCNIKKMLLICTGL